MRPESIRVDPRRTYAFRSRFKTFLVSLLDGLGNRFFKKNRNSRIQWDKVRRIAVLRLDHLGDVLMALPTLEALRETLPKAEIDFWVGPWGREVAEMSRLAHHVPVFEAPWFSRPPKRGLLRGCMVLARLLREANYDAVIDLRGDCRHILAAWMSRIPVRIGQTLTGGGFLLSHPVHHVNGLHETEQGLNLLVKTGLHWKRGQPWPVLKPSPENAGEAQAVREKLGLQKPMIALHATAGTQAKRWPGERWSQLVDALPADFEAVFVGTDADRNYLEEVFHNCGRKPSSAAGLLSLPALAAFLKDCRLFIGVDSGPAHIAAAVGTPVVSLYSGTNMADQWAPRGPRVTVIQKRTPCSPCELQVCPIGNECMRQISVDEVLAAVKTFLGE